MGFWQTRPSGRRLKKSLRCSCLLALPAPSLVPVFFMLNRELIRVVFHNSILESLYKSILVCSSMTVQGESRAFIAMLQRSR